MSLLQKFVHKKFLEPGIQMRASQFVELLPPPGAVVFIGDSITEGGAWDEWFPDHRVINRGISGDTAAGVRTRVAVAVRNSPSMVALLIGTNDIGMGRKKEEILADVQATIDTIRAQAPEAAILLQSIMPRQAKFRARIDELNAQFRQIAEATSRARYVDLWPVLADRDALRPGLTLDGPHLNGAGYRAWAGVLQPLLPRD